VVHPVVYSQKKTHHEENIWAMASLYTLDENEFGVIECRKENRKFALNREKKLIKNIRTFDVQSGCALR